MTSNSNMFKLVKNCKRCKMKNSANYYNKFKRKNNKIENPILINYERDIDKIHKYIKIQRLCY